MFKALGIVVALYTIYAAVTGSVYAKSGAGGRLVSRQASPQYFWIVITIYASLCAALLFIF